MSEIEIRMAQGYAYTTSDGNVREIPFKNKKELE